MGKRFVVQVMLKKCNNRLALGRESNRMVYLYGLYEKYTADLFIEKKQRERNNIELNKLPKSNFKERRFLCLKI